MCSTDKEVISIWDLHVFSSHDSNSFTSNKSGTIAARPVKFHILGPISLNRRSCRFLPRYMFILSIRSITGEKSLQRSCKEFFKISARRSKKFVLLKKTNLHVSENAKKPSTISLSNRSVCH